MPHFHYLTIQDILWINQEITRKAEKFDFARLEEAVFYQYALGDNKGLAAQATRLLSGFLRMKPFDEGNEATALVACAAFVRLNGRALKLSPGDASAFLAMARGASFSLDSHLGEAPADEHLDAKAALSAALTEFGNVLTTAA